MSCYRGTSHVFYFQHENWGDMWKEIRAVDHEGAAESFAEIFDNGDYTLAKGNTTTVSIRDADGVVKRFRVRGETMVRYHANEIEGE